MITGENAVKKVDVPICDKGSDDFPFGIGVTVSRSDQRAVRRTAG